MPYFRDVHTIEGSLTLNSELGFEQLVTIAGWFPSLVNVRNNVDVMYMRRLQTLAFPALVHVGGNVNIQDTGLQTLAGTFPVLESASNVRVYNNHALTSGNPFPSRKRFTSPEPAEHIANTPRSKEPIKRLGGRRLERLLCRLLV